MFKNIDDDDDDGCVHITADGCLARYVTGVLFRHFTPRPSGRHHLSYDNCLENKRENYQDCTVLYCVQQLCKMTELTCTMIRTHEQFLRFRVGF